MGVGHYENFPVASWLAPASLRPAVRAIYRFARTADDIADEGDTPAPARLAQLAALGRELDAIERGAVTDWPDLAVVIDRHRLPIAPLRALLSAFAQDVTVHRYEDFDALRDYCRRSADPIGRLLLALYRRDDAPALARADAICTALQWVNFWQDIAVDWRKGRVYVPQAELRRHGLVDADIGAARADARWGGLMSSLTSRARHLLLTGAPLASMLGGRIGIELRAVVHGGLRILERIDTVRGDVFRQRPTLGAADWLLIGARAIRGVPPADTANVPS